MQEITKAEREELRRSAQSLRPLVQIGKLGVTDTVVESIDQALAAHELVKIRFGGSADQRQGLAEDIARRLDAVVVTVIGHVAVLFRRNEPNAQ